jgi:hypothetical protein
MQLSCKSKRFRVKTSNALNPPHFGTPPSKNALSTANRERSAQMAQDLYQSIWAKTNRGLKQKFVPTSLAQMKSDSDKTLVKYGASEGT